MRKILIIACSGLGNGGVETSIMSIVRRLHDKYIFDILLFDGGKSRYEDEFLSYGGKIFRCLDRPHIAKVLGRTDVYTRTARIYKAVKKIIKENGPYEAVHCNNKIESCLSLKAAKECGVPVRIYHVHIIMSAGGHFIREIFYRKCAEAIDKYSTFKVGCSEFAYKSLFGDDGKCNVIYNPYDEERFNSEKGRKAVFEAPVLAQVGLYSVNKNQLFTVDIFEKIVKKYPEARLLFLGFSVDAYFGELKEEIKKRGLSEKVVFYDENTDVSEVLKGASCFMLPSRNEGFGIVLIEAQAMGLTCYVSDTVPAITNVGGCKFLPLGDGAEAWAKIITEDFEKDRGARHSYDCSAFASENTAKAWEKIYRGEDI